MQAILQLCDVIRETGFPGLLLVCLFVARNL